MFMDAAIPNIPASPDYQRITRTLAALASQPPQSLLLEGGNGDIRLELAKYWGAASNCPEALAQRQNGTAAPCLRCAVCKQIFANENIDLHIFDGRIGNKEDEEKPGPIRALRMENIRELRSVLGAQPHGDGKRIIVIQGMSSTREEALNSLLKILEEPSRYNLFVLLASQRQQLLPTLVSRSFCMTLPWRSSAELAERAARDELVMEFANFLKTGSGFLGKISAKNALTSEIAGRLILMCQTWLIDALTAEKPMSGNPFQKIVSQPQKTAILTQWLSEAQGMLEATVSPVRVMAALSAKLFVYLRSN